MTCAICQEIENKKNIVYQDKLCVAFLHPLPSVKGHIVVAPREHYPILEQTPEEVVQHTFFVANKASMLAFEALKVQGTNITVSNGVPAGQDIPHFSVNVLPRTEKDGIDFNFKRAQAKQEDLKKVQSAFKDVTDLIGHEKKAPVIEEKEIEQITETEEENYLLKQLRRIP